MRNWIRNKKSLVLVIALVVVLVGGTALAFGVSSANRRSWNISEQEAKNAAFAHAGIAEADVVALQVRKEMDDGASVYEIEFRTADRRYDYDVSGSSGEILRSSYDTALQESGAATGETTAPTSDGTVSASTQAAAAITEDEAKRIALADAGVAESDVQFIRVKQDRDDGRDVYDVEFYAGTTEYDYEIEIAGGRILSSDFDIEDYVPQAAASSAANNGGVITLEEATAIALARVSGATERDIRIHLDHDDGRQIYEGEIHYDRMEYEFEIDATTGSVIEWSADHWD